MGRGGYIEYHDDKNPLRFSFEFGGRDCIVIIFIPTPENWEKETNRTFSERNDILKFVAEQSIQDQVSGGYYKLSDQFIELYGKKYQ